MIIRAIALFAIASSALACTGTDTEAFADAYVEDVAEYSSQAHTSSVSGNAVGKPATSSTFSIYDQTRGMEAMTISVPAGFRAEGALSSSPIGGKLADMLVLLNGPNRQQIVILNSVDAKDPQAVFGGQARNLLADLQQHAAQLAGHDLQRIGHRISKPIGNFQLIQREPNVHLYGAEFGLAGGQSGVVIMPVLQSAHTTLGFLQSNHLMLVIGPDALGETGEQALLKLAGDTYRSMKENQQWARATTQSTQQTIASRNAQQQQFNRQMRANSEAMRRNNELVAEGNRRLSDSYQERITGDGGSMQHMTDVLSDYGRYIDPHTGQEMLISDDLGPGSNTYINQQGDYLQVDDPSFDPYSLPDGYQQAGEYDYYPSTPD